MPRVPSRLPAPAWLCATLLLALGTGARPLLPHGLPRGVVVVGCSMVLTLALALGSRRTPSRLWRVLAVAPALNTLGWGLWLLAPPLLGLQLGTPNVGDALFVGSSLVSIVVVAGLSRASGADRGSVLDAAVLATSFGVTLWVTVASPQASAGVTLAARAVSVSYPLLDVLLLAVAVPLVLARTRTPRALLLVGWVVLQLASDVVYGREVVAGTFTDDSRVFLGWLASWALLAGAALHPSATGMAGTTRRWRRAVLLMGVLPLPAILVVRIAQGSAESVPLVGAATVVVTVLAVARAARRDASLPADAERSVRRSMLRLAAAVVVFALLPLASLTALAVSESRSAVDVEVSRRLQTTAEASAVHVEQQLAVLQELVSAYADRPGVRRAVASPGSARGTESLSSHLDDLAARSPSYVGAWFLDAGGRLRSIAPAQPSLVGRSFASHDFYREVERTGRPYVSGAFRMDTPGGPQVVAVAAPVRVAGVFRGVVVLGCRLDSLGGFVGRLAGGQDAAVLLTDGAGTLLAGSAAREGAVVDASREPGVAAALRGERGLTRPGARDTGLWTAYAPLPSLGWGVVATIPGEQAYASAERLSGRLVAAATLLAQVLLSGLLLGVGVERRRRQAEVRLAVREEQVGEILSAAGDAFLAFSEDGHVLRWNRRAEELFGWTAEQAVGQPLVDLIVPVELQGPHRSWLQASVASAGAYGTPELELARADGSRFLAECTIWSTPAEGGPTLNAFVRDVTQQREHEEALAHARDEALRASRLKSEFVANMSHEVRTPMNGVSGMTTLLLDTDLDERQRRLVETLRASADALLTVIDDVLAFSKLEAGTLDVDPTDVEVRPLVEEVLQAFAAVASLKGLTVAVVVDPAVPQVLRVDGHRLRQLLSHLLGNAVKFTGSGEVSLEVRHDGVLEGGVLPLRFDVRDTGPGIEAGAQERLFEAFAQADTSTTREHGGTGLGLTLSRSLARLMGGELTVDSTPGVGSTFSVALPLAVVEQAPAPLTADLSGLRVLVADGSPTGRRVLEDVLVRWQAEVSGVPDGIAALAALRIAAREGHPFDLALLDARIPGLDALVVAQAAATDPTLAGLRVVLVSAGGSEHAPGVHAVLAVPVREPQLRSLLLEQVSRDQPAAAPAAAAAAVPRQRRASGRGRVLVAEDNAVNQMVVREMLQMLGFEVDVVGDGAQAVDRVRAGAHDLVLMDCQMPVLDGLAATARIRRLEGARGRVPIVALTASAMVSDRERCFEAGMDDFLAKPLRLEELDAALTRVLDRLDVAVG